VTEGAHFWDREIAEPQHVSWLEDARVREYVNTLVGGDAPAWPLDWFERWLGGRRFARALSIGCGGGALERDLVRRGLCARVDAFDGSVASLNVARRAALAAGMSDRIRYFAADFNEPALPRRTYDLVLFHQSAHHVAKLEKINRAILGALEPDGVLYLDEYVGPSRFEWTDDLLAAQRSIFASLPRELCTSDELPFPIQQDDPSEAFRSSEIEPQLSVGFRTVARRPYGGTLLSVVFPLLRREKLDEATMARLIAAEREMLAAGAPSYYTIIVARPRRGLARLYGSLHYFAVPKLKRVAREVMIAAPWLTRSRKS
jgi:SAM-dependent methyltransferase